MPRLPRSVPSPCLSPISRDISAPARGTRWPCGAHPGRRRPCPGFPGRLLPSAGPRSHGYFQRLLVVLDGLAGLTQDRRRHCPGCPGQLPSPAGPRSHGLSSAPDRSIRWPCAARPDRCRPCPGCPGGSFPLPVPDLTGDLQRLIVVFDGLAGLAQIGVGQAQQTQE